MKASKNKKKCARRRVNKSKAKAQCEKIAINANPNLMERRTAEKSHHRKKGRFSMKRYNGVEIVEPIEVPEAPAHGTGRLVLAACRRYLDAHGWTPERKQESAP